MDGVAAIATGAVLALLVGSQGLVALAHWRVQLTSPRGIMQRLRGHDRRHSVRFGPNRFAWNPALATDVKNKVPGPGLAHYSLDESGVVHLVFVSGQGEVQRFSGPVPDLSPAADSQTPASYLVGQPVVATGAFAMGYLLSGGSTDSHLVVGFLAGIGGWVVTWAAIATSSSIMRTRAYAAQRD